MIRDLNIMHYDGNGEYRRRIPSCLMVPSVLRDIDISYKKILDEFEKDLRSRMDDIRYDSKKLNSGKHIERNDPKKEYLADLKLMQGDINYLINIIKNRKIKEVKTYQYY